MKIRHIYWFAYFNLEEPSVWYRAKYPLEWLKKTQNIGEYYQRWLEGFCVVGYCANFLNITT